MAIEKSEGMSQPPSHVVIAINSSEHSKYAFEWTVKNLLHVPTHRVTLLTVLEPPVQAEYYYAASAGKEIILYLHV